MIRRALPRSGLLFSFDPVSRGPECRELPNHAPSTPFSCFSGTIRRGVTDRDLGGGVVGAFVEKWFSPVDDAVAFQGGKYEGEMSSLVGVSSSENDSGRITGCEEMSYGDVIRKDGGGGGWDMYSDAEGEKGGASWAP